MSISPTLEFHLPEGWTLRQVATALVREWLPPFRAEPAAKGARWAVHSVVEGPGGGEVELWEPGISTGEYEARLNRTDLCWAIRASAGRGKRTILARLAMKKDQPQTFQVALCQSALPDALFDVHKLDQLGASGESMEMGDLFAALFSNAGFQSPSST